MDAEVLSKTRSALAALKGECDRCRVAIAAAMSAPSGDERVLNDIALAQFNPDCAVCSEIVGYLAPVMASWAKRSD